MGDNNDNLRSSSVWPAVRIAVQADAFVDSVKVVRVKGWVVAVPDEKSKNRFDPSEKSPTLLILICSILMLHSRILFLLHTSTLLS